MHVNMPYKQTTLLVIEISIGTRILLPVFSGLFMGHSHINMVFFYLSITLPLRVLLYYLPPEDMAFKLAETSRLALYVRGLYSDAPVSMLLPSRSKEGSSLFWVDSTLPPIVPVMILNRF